MTPIHLLHITKAPILQQLQLEEALLRTSTENWCLVNEGSTPCIVLGISQTLAEVVDMDKTAQLIDQPHVVQRFSGGGAVVVDDNTLFITLILRKHCMAFSATPQELLAWTSELYRPALLPHTFTVQENDYALTTDHGLCKIGGNAQYFTATGMVHHTSFLWDFDEELMNLLYVPQRQPAWRRNRPHTDFLARLKEYFPDRSTFLTAFKTQLAANFHIVPTTLDMALQCMTIPHRTATRKLGHA